MRKATLFLFSAILFLLGIGLFRTTLPVFEISQDLQLKRELVTHDVDFTKGGVFVSRVSSNSPAADSGIETGSQIVSVNNIPIKDINSLIDTVDANLGKSMELTVCNSNNCREISVIPKASPGEDRGPLGVTIYNVSPLGKSTAQIIYDEIYKRFIGNDIFTLLFGTRVLVARWIALALASISTILSFVLFFKGLRKRSH